MSNDRHDYLDDDFFNWRNTYLGSKKVYTLYVKSHWKISKHFTFIRLLSKEFIGFCLNNNNITTNIPICKSPNGLDFQNTLIALMIIIF